MTRVVCIGECMVELRSQHGAGDCFARSYAGDAYNTAVYLKRSLPGSQVQFLTATGDDSLSSAMRRAWHSHGIDAELAFTVSGGTPGLYFIEAHSSGEHCFEYSRKESAARRWLPLLLAHGESKLWGADLVYLSGISLAILRSDERARAIALIERLKGRVGRIAFDPNIRLSLWERREAALLTIGAALEMSDIALPSAEDLQLLLAEDSPQKQLRLLHARGSNEVALTLGSDGCVVSERDKRSWMPAVTAAHVIDMSGAGDSFNGAYLAARLDGGSSKKAAEFAMAVASRVVSHRGAIVPVSISHPLSAA